ncbi:unnamed protein product [Closterium sp. NIES-53]
MRSLRAAQALYDAVVARYSSPATTALGRLLLPYLFPELSAFATVEDLVTHLRTSDARYRAALPVEFLDRNPPPVYITLYFIITRLPDSLRAVRDHFLALDPTALTIDLLEQHLLAVETSVVALGAARGTPRKPPLPSPLPLLPPPPLPPPPPPLPPPPLPLPPPPPLAPLPFPLRHFTLAKAALTSTALGTSTASAEA